MLDDLAMERDLYAVQADSMLMLCMHDDVTMGTPWYHGTIKCIPSIYPSVPQVYHEALDELTMGMPKRLVTSIYNTASAAGVPPPLSITLLSCASLQPRTCSCSRGNDSM